MELVPLLLALGAGVALGMVLGLVWYARTLSAHPERAVAALEKAVRYAAQTSPVYDKALEALRTLRATLQA